MRGHWVQTYQLFFQRFEIKLIEMTEIFNITIFVNQHASKNSAEARLEGRRRCKACSLSLSLSLSLVLSFVLSRGLSLSLDT